MGRGSRLAYVLAIATAGVACSLTADLGGFSGGENAATDGGSTADVIATDSPTSGADATSDGPTTILPNKSFSCADHPTATFCADFNSAPFNAGWTDFDVCNNGCGVSLDSTTSVSPPSSFHAMKPAHAAGNLYASLYKEIPKAKTTHFELDVRFEKIVEPSFGLTVFYFCFRNATTGCGGLGGFNLRLIQSALQIQTETVNPGAPDRDYATFDFKAPTLPKFQEWVHFAFDLTIESDKSSLVVKMDGVDKIGKPIDLMFHTWANDSKVSPAFNVGLFYIYPSTEQHVWIDNVLVETQ